MAVNVAKPGKVDEASAEAAMWEEIRRWLAEAERLHIKMQDDEERARIVNVRSQTELDELKAEMHRLFAYPLT